MLGVEGASSADQKISQTPGLDLAGGGGGAGTHLEQDTPAIASIYSQRRPSGTGFTLQDHFLSAGPGRQAAQRRWRWSSLPVSSQSVSVANVESLFLICSRA